MSATDTAGSGDMSLTVLMIVNNQDRSRDFYHNVMGAEIARDRDPAILRFHNGVIVLNVGGSPTDDKPTVTMAPPPTPTPSAWPSTSAWPTSRRYTMPGASAARSSSPLPRTVTVRSAATCATQTAT
jgi:catechol 2,3-dioxygenase-like lactoylglutathione lyase family enzyme